MSTLVDSNVLIDVLSEDVRWFDWSARALAEAAEKSVLGINPIIFAELAVGFTTEAGLVDALADRFERWALPYEAGYAAGRAFADYRRKGGVRRSPLPDFYIGAHALAEGHSILTRDPTRYRTYFPRVKLICP